MTRYRLFIVELRLVIGDHHYEAEHTGGVDIINFLYIIGHFFYLGCGDIVGWREVWLDFDYHVLVLYAPLDTGGIVFFLDLGVVGYGEQRCEAVCHILLCFLSVFSRRYIFFGVFHRLL